MADILKSLAYNGVPVVFGLVLSYVIAFEGVY